MPTLHFSEHASPAITVLEDGTRVYRTCSAGIGCHNLGCGLKVHVKDGQLVKVEGDEEHPISKGRLCVRCLTAKEYYYHKDRLLYPMKRAREDRGRNRWERISWDEALETIIAQYRKTVEGYGIGAVSVWCGTGREASQIHFQMANDVFGTVNAVHPNSGWSCIVPRMAAMLWTMGSSYIEADNAIGFPDRYDDPRWECPRYLLVWGRDPLRSNPDGLFGHSLVEMMKRGMKLVVVDPRVNWLATRAEVHLQLRPGTDGALALGLLNVVIEEDLYDHGFVEQWCYGFYELAERVQEYPVDRVAKICEVDADDIRTAARCVSQVPSALSMGLAVDQNPNTLQIGHALLSLFAICGSMDVPGGCFMGLPPIFAGMAENAPVADGVGEPEGLAKFGNVGVEPLGHDRYPAMSAIVNTTHPDATLDVLETNVPYGIHFAYAFGHNTLSCMVPQPQRWYEAMRKIDFIAVADLFMTPTIMGLADLVLPAATFFEKQGYVSNNNASQPGQMGAIVPVLEPAGECRADLEIMLELHRRLYPDSEKPGWASATDFIDSQLGKMRGVDATYDDLCEHVIGQYEIEYRKYEKGLLRADGQPGFNTPTGRIELYSTVLQNLGDDPLPYYLEPKFSAVSRPDLAEEYPLTLTTGARRFTSFHSENRQIATLREIHPQPTVDIHPATAAGYGIAEGSYVWVENHLGRARMMAHLTPIVKENVVSCDHGWWLPEADPENLFDVFEMNVNQLIPHEENGPLGFGTHYKSMPCKIYRTE
ncbi:MULTISPECIES: molybdopterin-dependent oxidoreductase [Gordonibacter]|uniref:Molybdopterin-dependent oxidoreductase n=1 Tax=Gordonibacter faecis TaxID=3047475 RepID=A0ABT7DR48_9ACTN|nr:MULTISPECIES: molybdopterin-dependent oxidoreductase [unclassified Gordonibacter]MDJ1650630.1 molybdopterin-dependent oxidoreductase [Gordonibacter sp. KGMB12511]HIW75798.1 molybdopterin-dependent oxidoreductase [Candidatus Gordonibacter avicola]